MLSIIIFKGMDIIISMAFPLISRFHGIFFLLQMVLCAISNLEWIQMFVIRKSTIYRTPNLIHEMSKVNVTKP